VLEETESLTWRRRADVKTAREPSQQTGAVAAWTRRSALLLLSLAAVVVVGALTVVVVTMTSVGIGAASLLGEEGGTGCDRIAAAGAVGGWCCVG